MIFQGGHISTHGGEVGLTCGLESAGQDVVLDFELVSQMVWYQSLLSKTASEYIVFLLIDVG